jgi:pectate lyase-like protein
MATCNLTGAVRDYDGSDIRAGSQLFIHKVLPGDSSTTIFGTHLDTHTMLASGLWWPLIEIERSAVAYISMAAPGFDADMKNGTPLVVPNTSSATLASLPIAINLPTQVPVAIPPEVQPIVVEAAWFDVTQSPFNATGDGSTNDYTAINAALTAAAVAGGTVYFPPGVYIINTRLQPASNVVLLGAGQKASLIKAGPSLNVGTNVIDLVSKSHVRIAHLGITSTNEVSAGVGMNGCINCVVDEVWFDDNMQWNSLIGNNSLFCGLINCIGEGTTLSQNLEINSSSYCFAIKCRFLNATGNGVEIYHNDISLIALVGNKIISCHIEGAAGGGIFPSGDIGSILDDNTIIGCGNHGFLVTQGQAGADYPSLGGKFVNNVVRDCGAATAGHGAVLGGGSIGWSVDNNTLQENAAMGIVNGGFAHSITDNFCYLNNSGGIYSEEDSSVYKGNRCINNSAGGAGQMGINLLGDFNLVETNICTDTRLVKLQSYGLLISGNDNIIGPNQLRANADGEYLDSGLRNMRTWIGATSAGNALFAIDAANGVALTIANNATATPFGNTNNFSGVIYITDPTQTGALGVINICGNTVEIYSDPLSKFSITAATADKINVYLVSRVVTIENKLGGSANLNIFAIRTRTEN